MDEQLRDGLLSIANQIFQIGYLILSPDLIIRGGNDQIGHWLESPLNAYVGLPITEAFPELVGSESCLYDLRVDGPAYRLEEIFRPSIDGLGNYFDLHVLRLKGDQRNLLLSTVDITARARQEQVLQQQRNEVQLLSAELAMANDRLSYIINRLVPTPIARSMMRDRKLPEPGGNMVREASILFADMRDFTAYAESYQPSDTLEFLNTYLAIVSEAILRHEGSLVQLVGDMVMGVFNIPDDQPDHAARAVRAAIDIQSSLHSFNQKADSRFPAVSFGIGISTGSVISGYLGFQQRFRYAVVGDATNVAFHLSSLAAAGRILLSETTVAEIGNSFPVMGKGDFQLKRRRKPVKVYEMSSLTGFGDQ